MEQQVKTITIEVLTNKLSILNSRLGYWEKYLEDNPKSETINAHVSSIKIGIEQTTELLKEEIGQ